jgi:AcrR family transcriptional regulator
VDREPAEHDFPRTAESGSRSGRRAEEKRLAILRAAARVFRDRGFARAGMRDIAAAADLSPANLYYYFSSKHEILYFCQDRTLARMSKTVADAKSIGAGRAEQLFQILRSHILCMLDDVEGSTAHLEIDALPPDLRDPIVAKRDEYERSIRALIAEGRAMGDFACDDPMLTTRAILGALNWTARWFRPDGHHSAQSVADSTAWYLVRGLAPVPGPERRAAGPPRKAN